MLLLNLLLYLKVTIAGVGQQGNWDNQSDISVRLGSHPAVGDTNSWWQLTERILSVKKQLQQLRAELVICSNFFHLLLLFLWFIVICDCDILFNCTYALLNSYESGLTILCTFTEL